MVEVCEMRKEDQYLVEFADTLGIEDARPILKAEEIIVLDYELAVAQKCEGNRSSIRALALWEEKGSRLLVLYLNLAII